MTTTAEAIAGRLDMVEGRDWQIAWQSAGRTPEPWLGPDILEVIDGLGARLALGFGLVELPLIRQVHGMIVIGDGEL